TGDLRSRPFGSTGASGVSGVRPTRFMRRPGGFLALAFALALPGGPAEPADDLGRLKQLFARPPESAKPMTRWWWFGGAVTPEEITRELTFMKDAGLRGAEIQPV